MPKLFVICGHGAGDPGAVGNGYKEADLVRKLGKRIKELGGSKVILADVNRNYYADDGISRMSYAADAIWIVELHMDSANADAQGAHVEIKKGFEADTYDTKIANYMANLMPGRSEKIKYRSDLGNMNAAAARGYNYRLVEHGFISDKGDVDIFLKNIDNIANMYLETFGIKKGSSSSTTNKPSTSKPSTSTSTKLDVDGWWGKKTTKALQKCMGTTQDSIVSGQDAGSKQYHENCEETTFEYGSGGSNVIRALQKKLGVDQDGYFGPLTIKALQKKVGTKVDGYCGANTVKGLQKWINNGCK